MSERPYDLVLTVRLKVNGDSRDLAIDHLEQCVALDGPLALFRQVAADGQVEFRAR